MIQNKKTKLVYFIGFHYDKKLNFVKLNAQSYEDALKIAKCMFGEKASKVIFTKEMTIFD